MSRHQVATQTVADIFWWFRIFSNMFQLSRRQAAAAVDISIPRPAVQHSEGTMGPGIMGQLQQYHRMMIMARYRLMRHIQEPRIVIMDYMKLISFEVI